MKRRIREWFRRHRGDLPVSRDIVIIARAGAALAARAVIESELSASACQIGTLLASPSRT
jgi:ribonuclease P protein component